MEKYCSGFGHVSRRLGLGTAAVDRGVPRRTDDRQYGNGLHIDDGGEWKAADETSDAAKVKIPEVTDVKTTTPPTSEDKYSFLSTFDTVILIDDSGSMAGHSWKAVSQALTTIAPIVTQHDSDGIDLYFSNHKYQEIKEKTGSREGNMVAKICRARASGSAMNGARIQNIPKPYISKYEGYLGANKSVGDLKTAVTDGLSPDDIESVLTQLATERGPFSPHGCVKYIQSGNDALGKNELKELDNNSSGGGIRDLLDSVTWKSYPTIVSFLGSFKNGFVGHNVNEFLGTYARIQ